MAFSMEDKNLLREANVAIEREEAALVQATRWRIEAERLRAVADKLRLAGRHFLAALPSGTCGNVGPAGDCRWARRGGCPRCDFRDVLDLSET